MENSDSTYRERILKESGLLMKIGTPVIITQLLQISMNFVDTIMAGRLSPEDLAAIAVGTSVLMPVVVLCMGCLMAVTPIVAQNVGSRNLEDIGKNARQVMWLSQILALPAFFILRNLDFVFELLQVTDEIVPIASGYLQAISWGIFPVFAYAALRHFNEGLSVTRPAMYIAIIGTLVNIPANYVLMFGKLGFPELGAIGTGYASSLVYTIMFVAILWFTASHEPYERFGIFRKFRWPEKKYLKELVQIGTPIGISSSMEVSMFAAVSLLISSLSILEVAAHQIAINFASICFMIPLGLSIAISARVGNSMGRNKPHEARFRGYVGVGISTIFMISTATILFLFPRGIISIYTSDPGVAAIAVQLLYMAAIFQISDGLQVSGYGALRGLKDTKVPMVVNLLAYWVIGIPTAYLLGFTYNYGAPGFWVGLIAGLTAAGILHNTRFFIKTKR